MTASESMQQVRERQVAQRAARVAVDEVRQVAAQLPVVERVQRAADRQDGGGQPLRVLAHDRVHHPRQRVAQPPVEAADAAEVEQADDVARAG